MDYRSAKNLSTDWGWMHLPAGALMEVKGLIFRTTGRKKKKKGNYFFHSIFLKGI